MTNHTVITGGPSTGKTSLIDCLRERGHPVSPEAAKDLIARGFAGEPIPLPWEDLDGFEREVHLLQRRREAEAHAGTFFDRSLVDILVYCEAYGIPPPPGIMDDILKRDYGPVFVLARLPVFSKETYRSEADTEGHRLGSFFAPVYTRLGFTVIETPAFVGAGDTLEAQIADAIGKRADFVIANRNPESGKEIEIKTRTKDIERVRRTLSSYQGSVERVAENDRYIPVPSGAHRIRQRTYDNGRIEYIETTKGPKEQSELTVRPEDEHFVDENAYLNAPFDVEVKKVREIFRPRFSPGVSVTIDDVADLGHFVEIEGPTRHAVNQWAGQLLLPPMLWEKKSYETLTREHRG